MIHFAMYWPAIVSLDFCPFPVDHAIHIWNQLPNKNTKIAPIDVFTELLHFGDLQRLHVFGYPVYVLDPVLQDGKRLPKLEKKSRWVISVDLIQLNDSNITLVLNPTTGKISLQYHLIYDDHSSTAYSDCTFDINVWDSIVASYPEYHIDCPEVFDATPTVPLPSHPEATLLNVDAELQQMFNKFTSLSDPADPLTDTDGTDFPNLPLPASSLPSNIGSNNDNLPSVPEGE